MNFNSFLYTLFILFALVGCSNENNTENNSANNSNSSDTGILNLPDAFKNLPVGIEVVNIPDTIFAEINENGPKKYIWKHTTTIKALYTDLTIVEFGSYNFKYGRWVLGDYTNKPFTTNDFDKWYCRKKNGIITFDYCKEGKIQKDVEYIDPSNYCIRKDTLVNRNGLWYFIGIDAQGNKCMGYGRYVVVDKLKN